MKAYHIFLFALFTAFSCIGCSKTEDEPDPQDEPEEVADISTSLEITPYGGTISASDENGMLVRLTFPPGALRDTSEITLTIQGKSRDLPLEEKLMRTIEIQPSDLNLYIPALLTVEYPSSQEEPEEAAIFDIRSEELLYPLKDHEYMDGGMGLSAYTITLDEYVIGKMTLDQINAQLDQLVSETGVSFKSTGDCELIKVAWDDWLWTAKAISKFFVLRNLLGYYQLPQANGRTFDEDIKKVCENFIAHGVEEVLKLGPPADPCCPEYTQTIQSMMQAMYGCGLESPVFDQLSDAYNQVNDNCPTYLEISTEIDMGNGDLVFLTSGYVFLSLDGLKDGEASVSGTGELMVSGGGNAGGPCQSTITGLNFTTVSGSRDAAYIYSLNVDMQQVATMVTVCPDITMTTPANGGSARQIVLSQGNGFTIQESETIDEGVVTIQATLHNPYVPASAPY